MNYLAHFHLAGKQPPMIQGALLGDFIKGPLRGQYSSAIERGIVLHRKIDAMSDADAALKLARSRLPREQRRFSGIILDVVFDYFLSGHWSDYHSQDLPSFADTVYAALAQSEAAYPAAAARFAQRLETHQLLTAYGDWDTVDAVLSSIGRRLSFDNPLRQGAAPVEPYLAHIETAFLHFYPRVQHMAHAFGDAASEP